MESMEILEGDCLEVMPALSPATFDLIIADPPYNLGKRFGKKRFLHEFDDYLDFSRAWLKEAVRLLKPGGTMYVFMGVRFISYLYDMLDREMGMTFNSWITWHYTQGMGRTRGFSPRHEDILMFNKGSGYTFNLDAVRIPQKYYRQRNNMAGANPGDVWAFSHVHYSNPEREKHPTQKPEALVERMVLVSSHEGGRVLDPFAGSGTTLRVCQQLNRFCAGIESSPDYVALIKNRLQQPFAGFDSLDPRLNRIPINLPKK